jgi:hypothetical protein
VKSKKNISLAKNMGLIVSDILIFCPIRVKNISIDINNAKDIFSN